MSWATVQPTTGPYTPRPSYISDVPLAFKGASELPIEHGLVACYAGDRYLRTAVAATGTVDTVSWEPKDIYRAIGDDGRVTRIIVAHTHPSENPVDMSTPAGLQHSVSIQDMVWTGNALNHMRALGGLVFADHLVIGGDRALSIRRWLESNGHSWEEFTPYDAFDTWAAGRPQWEVRSGWRFVEEVLAA